MATATYTVLVDWTGDGDLVDANEDVSGYVRASPGIHIVRGRDQIRALAPPMAGTAECELDNQSKLFSPENASGALYGYLLPGRKVQVKAVYSATTYYLFTGILDDLPQHPARAERSVSLPSLGTLSRLAGKRISTALYASIRTDVALGYLLDAAGWPAADRVLDTGKTTLDWWWLQDEDAFDAAKTLLATEGPGAAIYEDGQGRIVFESRHYRLTTARSTASQATISDTGAEPLFSGFAYNPGLKDIINVCEITTKTRAAQVASVVWTLGQTITLAANEVRKYTVSASDPFTGAIAPVNVTDYTLNSGTLASATLDRTSGESCTITLTAGASGAEVADLQLRAQSVTTQATVIVANTISAATSISNFGRQIYTDSVRAEIPLTVAQDLVNAVVGRYQDPRPTVTLAINNGADARMTQILSREISDRVTVVEAQTGANHAYWIERVEHSVDEAGLQHIATMGCEKVISAQYAVWGTAVWGTDQWGF